MNILWATLHGIVGLLKFIGKIVVGTLTIVALAILCVGLVYANYTATQGLGTTFASVVLAGPVHYLANMVCDFTVGQAACATVKAASTQSAATDTSMVVQDNPNDPTLMTPGQAAMTSSLPVAIASDQTAFPVTIGASSNIIGNVRIDQTTPGTTNGVNLTAGTALAGKFGIDQTTPGTTNGVVLNSGTNTVGSVGTLPVTSGGLTFFFLQPAASDNHAVIKAGAGQVYKMTVTNNSATVNYLRLYNATTGFNGCNSASNLQYQVAIPAATTVGGISDSWIMGMAFATGISICVTSGYATNDTTNATATAMSVNIGYK